MHRRLYYNLQCMHRRLREFLKHWNINTVEDKIIINSDIYVCVCLHTHTHTHTHRYARARAHI